jgi:hypothetical protein
MPPKRTTTLEPSRSNANSNSDSSSNPPVNQRDEDDDGDDSPEEPLHTRSNVEQSGPGGKLSQDCLSFLELNDRISLFCS